MCSVDPDELTEMTKATEDLDVSGGDVVCRKCKESVAEVVLRGKDAYCRECFLSYFEHKFRSTIGKSKQIKPGDRVLVAVSGGASSTTLLHLIHSGLNENSHKRIRFEPTYLYIDEICLSNKSVEMDTVQKVCDKVTSYNYPCYITSLEQVMASNMPAVEAYTEGWQTKLQHSEPLKKQLLSLVSSCKTTSTQQDLHEQLRLSLILQCAQVLGFKKIFLGDNATTLSIRILSQVALGRGSHLPDQVHFKSVRENVEIYRPMREILENEVMYYLQLHNLTSDLSLPQYLVKGTSIVQCTEMLLSGLQKDFPATIPTVFRTGDKLVCTSQVTDRSNSSTTRLLNKNNKDFNVNSESEPCVLCGCNLDTNRGDDSAMRATQISTMLSHKASLQEVQYHSEVKDTDTTKRETKVSELESLQNRISTECSKDILTVESDRRTCDRKSGCCNIDCAAAANTTKEDLTKEAVERHLCYGCRILLRDMDSVHHLPVRVLGAAAERERRQHMKEQIQDFLL